MSYFCPGTDGGARYLTFTPVLMGGVPDVLPLSRDSWGCHICFTFMLGVSQISYLYPGTDGGDPLSYTTAGGVTNILPLPNNCWECPICLTFTPRLLGGVVDEDVPVGEGCGVFLVGVVFEDVLRAVLRVLGGVGELEQVLAQVEAEGELLQHGTGGDEETQGVGGPAGGLDELEHRQRDGIFDLIMELH